MDEEEELERCYQNVGGSTWDQDAEAPVVESPNLAKYPRHQRSLRPTNHVGHSRATKDLVFALRNMHKMSASTLDEWKRIHATFPDPDMEASRTQEVEEEEEESDEDSIHHSMAEESDGDDEVDHTQTFGQSSAPHASIELGSDTEGDDLDDDLDSDLSDFVVNDGTVEMSKSSSIIASSPPIATNKTYYRAMQPSATQDTEDELPDIAALVGKRAKDSSPSRTSVSEIGVVRERKRPSRTVFDDDSDE